LTRSLVRVAIALFFVLSRYHLPGQTVVGSSYAYLLKGNYYKDNGNPVAAVAYYNQCLTIDPYNTEALLQSAQLYLQAAQFDEAYSRYQAAAVLDTKSFSPANFLQLLDLLAQKGKSVELRKWIETYHVLLDDEKPYKDSVFYIVTNDSAVDPDSSDDLAFIDQTGSKISPEHLEKQLSNDLVITSMALASTTGKLYFTAKEATVSKAYSIVYPITDKKAKITEVDLRLGKLEIAELSVSPEGDQIVFSAVDPDSDTGFDLYRTSYDGKRWTRPEKLIPGINSAADERFPHIANSQYLYFSSDRSGGYGGFDIYRFDLDNSSIKATLMPKPVNSAKNEILYVVDSTDHRGFVRSDRSPMGNDYSLLKVNRYKLRVPQKSPADVSPSPTSRGFTAWTSSGGSARLFDNDAYFFFNFTPGVDYTLITEHDRYFEDKIVSTSTTVLTHKNFYTFHIKNSSGLYSESSKEDNLTENDLEFVHIEPGDLITFQLLPNPQSVDIPGKTKLQAFNESTYISINDTIVFSYIVEANPVTRPATTSLNLAALSSDSSDVVISNEKLNAVIAPPTIQVGQPGAVMSEPDVELNFDPNREFSLATVNKEYSQQRTSTQQKRPRAAAKATSPVDTQEAGTPVAESSSAASVEQETGDTDDSALVGDWKSLEEATSALSSEKGNQVEEEQISEVTEDKAAIETLDEDLVSSEKDFTRASDPISTLTINTNANLTTESDKRNESTGLSLTDQTDEINGLSPVEGEEKVAIETQEKKAQDVLSQEPSEIAENAVNAPSTKSPVATFPVVFRVQIAAAKTPLSESQRERLYDGDRVVTNLQIDGYYKYFVAETSDYEEAKGALRSAGVPGAFISAYQGQKRISLKEGIRLNQEFAVTDEKPTLPPQNEVVKEFERKHAQTDTIAETKVKSPSLANARSSTTPERPKKEVAEETDSAVESLEFRVQIAASKSKMTEAQIKRIYNGPLEVSYFTESGYFKYYIAAPSTFAAASEILRTSGVSGAFISAYKGDEKWKLSEAIRAVKQ
jgi:hypothetical protein